MNNEIDPKLLEFLQTLPPETQELLMQDFIKKQSQLTNQDGQQGIFTPGKDGSYIVPQQPTMLDAFDNKYRKRARIVGSK